MRKTFEATSSHTGILRVAGHGFFGFRISLLTIKSLQGNLQHINLKGCQCF
jgi:hypothetical protein